MYLLESLRVESFLGLFKTIEYFSVVVLHYLNPVALALVARFVALNLVLCILDSCLQLLLFVVELVLKGKEMLVQGDAVSQKRFIATRLILLVDLLVLKHLDLVLHGGDLTMQV